MTVNDGSTQPVKNGWLITVTIGTAALVGVVQLAHDNPSWCGLVIGSLPLFVIAASWLQGGRGR